MMKWRASWLALLPTAGLVAPPAHATVYMSVAEAQKLMFPAATAFPDRAAVLTAEQRKTIAHASGAPAPKKLQAWEARQGAKLLGWFIVDNVLGKHDHITYAVAFGPDGRIQSVEILEYRETYGGQIRNPRWRQQFAGKGANSDLTLEKDIKNISGATLSCLHVTQGIKGLATAVELLLVKA